MPVIELLDALATYRLAHLLTQDVVMDRPRDAIIKWASENKHPKLRYFVTCPWCTGAYVAVGVTVARKRLKGWDGVSRALAFSAVAGIISSALER